MRIAVGADHAGYAMKEVLAKRLVEAGHTVVDLGTEDGEAPVDDPDYATKTTWDFVRRALEPDLLSAEQKRIIAFAVSVAAGSDYGIDLFAHHARRLGASDDAIFETLAVVHRFAGLTKFATSLNLEPDRVPEF